MIAPWLIEKLEANREQARQDRASWDNQLSIEVDDPSRRPPAAAEPTTPGERTGGGIVTVDFAI